MADKKISDLTSYVAPQSGDVLPIVDIATGITKKVRVDNLIAGDVSDAVYGVLWNGVTTIAPSKNTVYDKIELLDGLVVHRAGSEAITGSKTFSLDINFTAGTKGLLWDSGNSIKDNGSTLNVVGQLNIADGSQISTFLNLNYGTLSTVPYIDASKNLVSSLVTPTELGYVHNVTSAIQTQLNAKQTLDATLTALAAYNTNGLLTQTAADTFVGRTLTGTANEITVTNGDGVSGNPTLSLPSALTFTGKTITGGTFASPALTTPSLGVATATSINGNTITTGTGTLTLSTFTLTVSGTTSISGTHTGTSSGTNTGDQTTVSGNAGTATALQNARTIGGVSFDGTANIVPQTIQSVNEATDTTCFPLFISASGTQSLQPLNNAGFTYNSNTNALTTTTFIGALTGNASTVTTNANLTGAITSTGNATVLGSFSSANLLAALTDPTGTGVNVFGTSPAITTSITTASTTFALINTTATTVNFAGGASTALNMGHASGTNTFLGATTFSQNVTLSGGTLAAAATAINLTGASPTVTASSGDLIVSATAAGQNISLRTLGGTTANVGTVISLSSNATNTSSSRVICTINGTYAPTSGTTCNMFGLNANPTLNETSTAANTMQIINVNPTVTSVKGTLYGIRSQIAASPTGGGTAWNLFIDGTAFNALAGRTFIGGSATSPTALVHMAAGTATASTAPLKFTSGTNLTTAEAGALEYNGTNFFATRTGTTRETLWSGNDAAAAPTTANIGVILDYYGTSATRVLTTPNSWASVVIGGTTYKIPLYT